MPCASLRSGSDCRLCSKLPQIQDASRASQPRSALASGESVRQYVSGVPHRSQEVLVTDGDELRCSHGTIAAAEAFRQLSPPTAQ